MKYRTFLKLYKVTLGLYPAAFRRRNEEQMCLTVDDMLSDIHNRVDAVRTIGWLIGDIGVGLVKERSKQAGEHMMKKQSQPTAAALLKAALLGLQIVLVPIAGFLFVEPIFNAVSEPKNDPYTYISWAVNLGPLCMLALSLYLLRNWRGATLWSWLVRGFVMGTVGVIGLGVFGNAVDHAWLSYHLYSHLSVNLSLYNWSILIAFLVGFYIVGRWFVQSAAAGKTKPTLTTWKTKRA